MASGSEKKNNSLPLWGNEKTMNMNHLILTNILSSHYFKVNLYELKTYHEVIDEIYYKVTHLEPWEKGSRVTAGQTGMCGGVRGVGAGGIVSTAYCILYKLFTLKLTRKQVVGLINHGDSPYIRALGFMYIRYTQPPADLWDWYKPYLDDEEKLDVKAGGGKEMTIGEMLWHFLSKLEWFSTLFPRIPVPIQKDLESKMSGWKSENVGAYSATSTVESNEADYTNQWKEETSRSPLHKNGRYREDDVGDSKHRKHPEDEEREEKRQRYERDRPERSKHHRSSDHRTSRDRSRSPYDSKSHRHRKVHHSHHRDSARPSSHHRDHYREERFQRDRRRSSERHSRSISVEKRHSHKHSHRRHHD